MRKLILTLALALAAATTIATAETLVTAETIATRIADTIQARLPTPGRYRVTLADASFTLPATANNRYDIAALTFDPARQTFAATLAYKNALGTTEYAKLNGAALAVLEVPALVRDVMAGETIVEADLTTVEIPADRASAQLITAKGAVAGLAARRQLRARAPLFIYDVKKVALVKKGDLVLITFALPGIELSAQGQAQADAGQGETVAVLNTRSRRTVEGRVTGAGTVTVTAPGATLAAN